MHFNLGLHELNCRQKGGFVQVQMWILMRQWKASMTASRQGWNKDLVTWSSRKTVTFVLLWSRRLSSKKTMTMCQRRFQALRMHLQTFYSNLQRKVIQWFHHIWSILLTNTSFEMNIVRRYIKSLAERRVVTSRYARELMNADWFCRVLVRDGVEKKAGCSILYMKDRTEKLPKKVELYAKDDTRFCTESRNALTKAAFSSLTAVLIWTCYEEMR